MGFCVGLDFAPCLGADGLPFAGDESFGLGLGAHDVRPLQGRDKGAVNFVLVNLLVLARRWIGSQTLAGRPPAFG